MLLIKRLSDDEESNDIENKPLIINNENNEEIIENDEIINSLGNVSNIESEEDNKIKLLMHPSWKIFLKKLMIMVKLY